MHGYVLTYSGPRSGVAMFLPTLGPAVGWLCSYLLWAPQWGGYVLTYSGPRSGELRSQKLKSHLVRTQSLIVLPLKPGVGQYITIHATLTARDSFLAYFYSSGPFTCIFTKRLLISSVLAVVNRWFLCRLRIK